MNQLRQAKVGKLYLSSTSSPPRISTRRKEELYRDNVDRK